MWTMRILLVTNILDEHRSLTNLVGNGNPLIWGGLGWCVIFSCIIFIGYYPVKYVRKYLGLKHTIAICESEKEKIKIKIDRVKLNKKKKMAEYKKKEKELKRESKSELKPKKESKKILEEEISELQERMEAEKEEYFRKSEKLQKSMEKYEREIEAAKRELEENKKITKEKMKKRIVACAMMVLILWADGNNMIVTAQELKDTLVESFDSLNDSKANDLELGKEIFEDITTDDKEKNIEILPDIDNNLREHMDYNFILEDQQLHKVLDDDIAGIIFLAGDSKNATEYEHFLTNCKEGNIIEILPKIKDDEDEEYSLNELLNEIAENLEKPFLEKIDKGKMIQTQIEWEQSVATSMELENIIDKRRQVLGMEDSISVRRTIYFQLANDYQRLGKECLIQQKNGSDICYYYEMSIYCCYCALGYERTNKNSYSDEKIMNYVKARYKDIIDNVKTEILIEELNSAENIYLLLNE